MRVRAGVIVCPIWDEVGLAAFSGEFSILIHYVKTDDGIVMSAAYTRYRGEITDISEKIKTITLIPGWQERVPGHEPIQSGYSISYT